MTSAETTPSAPSTTATVTTIKDWTRLLTIVLRDILTALTTIQARWEN